MRPRLAPLMDNPQPSPRYTGATVIGTGLTGATAITDTGHTATTGSIVRIGITGTTVPAIMGTTTVHTTFTGITVRIGAATAGIGVTGAAGNR